MEEPQSLKKQMIPTWDKKEYRRAQKDVEELTD